MISMGQGNCKFGPKCANIHVLPDGRRINYGKNGVTIGPTPITLTGTRQSGYPSTSALTNSLHRGEGASGYAGYPDERQHQLGRQPSLEDSLPIIDTTNYSHPGSQYGSPRDDSNRFGLGLSPVNANGLSVLDAPLPASFDSNGISNAARYPSGPFPSSVPSGFGLGSPSPSLHAAKEARTSETLKSLYNSAFGAGDRLTPTAMPSSSPMSQGVGGEEYFGKRIMHSSRHARAKALSSSVPKGGTVDRDWDKDFGFSEEDYVPSNLQDLLTPEEKARRGSLRAAEEGSGSDGTTKYGSPVGAASPSRWGPLFMRQKEEEMSKHMPASSFGHVGSPLRNSSLANDLDRDLNGAWSSPSQSVGGESMSLLTQQMQRTRLAEESGNPLLHPNTAAGRGPNGSGSAGMTTGGRDRERAMERHVSTTSIGSSVLGRLTTPIDEEDPAFVFSMDQDEDQQSSRLRKRGSSGLGLGGTGWSYAGVAAGKGAVGSSSKDPREQSVVVETIGSR